MADYVAPSTYDAARERDVWDAVLSHGTEVFGTAEVSRAMARAGTLWTGNMGTVRSYLTPLFRKWVGQGVLTREPYGVGRFRYRLVEDL